MNSKTKRRMGMVTGVIVIVAIVVLTGSIGSDGAFTATNVAFEA